MVALAAARDWLAAACNATPAQRGAVSRLARCKHPYALAPFAPMMTAEGWRIAAIMNPPPHLDATALMDWKPDGDVIVIHPKTGMPKLVGDEGGWIVGDLPHDSVVNLYTNGLAFVRAWAASRLAMIEQHKRGNVPGLQLLDRADHALPGLLLAGPLTAVCNLQQLLDRDRVRVDDPSMVRPLARALLRAKRVPIVEASGSRLRKAA